MKRLGVLISIVALWSLAFATPALAAVPGNDAHAGRTVIGSLPSDRDIGARTYTYTDRSSLDHIYYDRYSCRTGGLDVYVFDEQSGGRPGFRSPGSSTSRTGKVRTIDAARP